MNQLNSSNLLIEAENLNLENYGIQTFSGASNGQLISLLNGKDSGTASTQFTGASGYYDILIGYYDEIDGKSLLQFKVNDETKDQWRADQQLDPQGFVATSKNFTDRLIRGISLKNGDTLTIKGFQDQQEYGRIDFMKLIPSEDIIIEAEKLELENYELQNFSVASNRQVVSLSNGKNNGSASTEFIGFAGSYNIIVGYYDEIDGESLFQFKVNDHIKDEWKADQQLDPQGFTPTSKNFTERLIQGISLKPGDILEIEGFRDQQEYARFDFIKIIPSQQIIIEGKENSNIIQGDENKSDTLDYSQLKNGIIGNLSTGEVIKPLYGISNGSKIMPLGDSITAGTGKYPVFGGYRIQLWNNFLTDNLTVDFVGSMSNGPDQIDKNHEGHGGWKINQINDLINEGILNTYQPQTILLMIGTNDILKTDNSVNQMVADLDKLINDITEKSPNCQLLIGSIAPISPSGRDPEKIGRISPYNANIQELVADKFNQGKKIAFVDIGGTLSEDDLSDGVHPNRKGYDKMGDLWYDSLVKKDNLFSIENITGTSFNDTLIGNNSANIITGGQGDDLLTGGEGADVFAYEK